MTDKPQGLAIRHALPGGPVLATVVLMAAVVVAGAAIGTAFGVTLWYFFLNKSAPDHVASS